MDKKILVTRSSLPPLDEFINEIKDIWESHWMTNMGKYHCKLESLLLEYMKVQDISLFCNGHMALELAIQAMELKGEVITTPFTFASTTHAIVRNGLKPVFCDIDENNYTIDVSKLENLITENTSAIIPVHVYGNICDVDEISKLAEKYKLKVIYDAAHAFGVEYRGVGIGTFGDASMFSFHATKVFNTIEGGAITYKNKLYGEKLYNLKNFGIKSEEIIESIGSNAKMNEFQAAMGICNLRHIEEEIHKRRIIMERYRENFEGVKGLKLNPLQKEVKQNYAYFPVLFNREYYDRDNLYNKLKESNIYARKYFYPLTNEYDCYKEVFTARDTPIAKRIANNILTLPMYADLTMEEIDRICSLVIGR